MTRTVLEVAGLILAALVALHFHDNSVRDNALAQVRADSLHQARAHNDSLAAQLAAAIRLTKQQEAQAARQDSGRAVAVRALNGRLGALAASLRDSLSVAQRLTFDSLQAATATRDSLQTAQIATYRGLFLTAAAQRDTLSRLLAASQAQSAGLEAALIQARRKPFFDRTPVKVLALVGAFALGKWGR